MDVAFSQQDIQAVARCLDRAQRVLFGRGYRYADGDPDTWPLSPVLMTKDNGYLLLASALPALDDAVAWMIRREQGLRGAGLTVRGVILVGCVPPDAPAVERLLEGVSSPAAYVDAVGGQFRSRPARGIIGSPAGILRDESLRQLLSPGPRAGGAGVDCRRELARALEQVHEVRRFQAAVSRAKGGRKPYGAYAILAACIGLFAVQALLGVPVLRPSVRDLIAWGANFGPLIRTGQWWRLVTSMVLHVGLLHLLFNMYAMHVFGRPLERLQGTWRLLAYFVFGGLAGSVASLWWRPLAVSAGASGGLFGMVGAMAAIYARFWRDLPELMRKGIRSWLFTVLLYNAIFLLVPAIDGAAHVGGLVGGFLIGLALARSPRRAARPPAAALAAAAALLAVLMGFALYAIRRVPAASQPPAARLRPPRTNPRRGSRRRAGARGAAICIPSCMIRRLRRPRRVVIVSTFFPTDTIASRRYHTF